MNCNIGCLLQHIWGQKIYRSCANISNEIWLNSQCTESRYYMCLRLYIKVFQNILFAEKRLKCWVELLFCILPFVSYKLVSFKLPVRGMFFVTKKKFFSLQFFFTFFMSIFSSPKNRIVCHQFLKKKNKHVFLWVRFSVKVRVRWQFHHRTSGLGYIFCHQNLEN